jgi:hypothetical protein
LVLIGVSAGTTSGYRAIRTANRQLNDKVVMKHTPVGAAAGCDLLILIFKNQIKRSQPSAAPTGVLW